MLLPLRPVVAYAGKRRTWSKLDPGRERVKGKVAGTGLEEGKAALASGRLGANSIIIDVTSRHDGASRMSALKAGQNVSCASRFNS